MRAAIGALGNSRTEHLLPNPPVPFALCAYARALPAAADFTGTSAFFCSDNVCRLCLQPPVMLPARPLPRAAPRCSTDTCICTCAAACKRHAPHSYSQHCMRLAEADDARPIQIRRRLPHHPCALHLSSIGALVVRLGAVGRRRVQIAQLHRRYARHTTAPDQSDRKRFTRHSDRANPTRTLLYL